MPWIEPIVSGALIGAAQLHPSLAALAWAGIALFAFALRRPASVLTRVMQTWLLGTVANAVGAFWLVGTSRDFFSTAAAAPAIWLVIAAPLALGFAPVHAAVALLSRRGGAVGKAIAGAPRFWLPLGYVAGEALRTATVRFSVDWLCSQWRFAPVLRCLGLIGWTPTLLLCLFIAASVGDYAASRTWPRAVPAALLLLGLFALPPAAPGDLRSLQGLGVVHIEHADDSGPGRAPAGVDLLVWPEDSLWQQPKMSEQTAPGLHVEPPMNAAGVSHLAGATTWLDGGGRQNSALALADDGRVLAMRAKSWLMPVVEVGTYSPGSAPPFIEIAGRPIVTVVCIEALHRGLVAEGKARGGQLLAVLASDRLHGHTPVAERTSLAYLVLRAAEFHLPAVRASHLGRAAIVGPDGSLLGESVRGATGVLAHVDGRVIDHDVEGRPLVTMP